MALIIILLMLFVVREGLCIIAFDCSSTINPETLSLSLVDTPKCSLLKRNTTSEDVVVQLIQPKTFDTTPYSQCLVEIDHLIFRCGKTFDNFHQQGLVSEIPDVTREECLSILKGSYIYEGLKIKFDQTYNVNFISAETYGSINEGSCTPGSYDKPLIINGISYNRAVRTSKFKITAKRGLATVDVDEKRIITEEGVKCPYHKLSCFSGDIGYVFWDSYFLNPLCKTSNTEYIPIFEGPGTIITEYHNHLSPIKSIIIHYQDYDYQIQLLDKTTRICNQLAIQTEHPKLAIVLSNINRGFDLDYDHEKMGKNVNIMTYFNSKLVYAMRHTKIQIDDLYNRLQFDRCLSEIKIIQSMISIARINPAEFAYEYFGSPGYTATIRGENIYITKCQPVLVNFTSIHNKCYNEIPVMYKGVINFILPRSHILSPVGNEVDCSSLLLIKYKIQEQWFSINLGGMYLTTPPEKIYITPSDDWAFKMINNFIEAGIYNQDDLDSVQKIIMNPIQREAMSTQIYRGLKGEGELMNGASVINLMNTKDIETLAQKTFGDFLGNLYSKISVFGNFIAGIIGIITIIRAIKFILNIFVNASELYKVFGFSWRLLLCWWENAVHHILRKSTNSKNTVKDQKVEDSSQNINLLRTGCTREDLV